MFERVDERSRRVASRRVVLLTRKKMANMIYARKDKTLLLLKLQNLCFFDSYKLSC